MIKGPILFLTGAGASVDSGLRTYRGKNGIYKDDKSPQEDLSLKTWKENPSRTWNTLHGLIKAVKQNEPGETYELIKKFSSKYHTTIFTQNVDGYSQYASKHVYELHGNLKSMTCPDCRMKYYLDEDNPVCDNCGKFCKPSIVLYGESAIDPGISLKPYETMIIIGTTLQFSYLRRAINKAKQKNATIIHINPDESYGSMVGKGEIWLRMKSSIALKLLHEWDTPNI